MKKVILFGLLAFGAINAQAQNWLLLGNAGTNPATNFLGTTDNKDVVLRRYNVRAGLLNILNTSFGVDALNTASTGIENTAIGQTALYSNTTGSQNTASGVRALYSNTTGGYLVAYGYMALNNNTTGVNNSATGAYALYANSTGSYNVANGNSALLLNSSGYGNVAVGSAALRSNTTGGTNTATGIDALYSNNTGTSNAAFGATALYYNSTGLQNASIGRGSLYYNTIGSYNAAVGDFALNSNVDGDMNSAIGGLAGPTATGLDNTTAVGYNAIPVLSNTVRLGNLLVTGVYSSGPYYGPSDGRFKKNVQENVPGLEFINQLKPVTYNFKMHELSSYMGANTNEKSKEAERKTEAAITAKEKVLYTGFIAQEVEKAAEKLGYNFSGVHKPENDKDIYALSYSEFVPPLVKAVQELSVKNEEKQNEIKELNDALKKLNDEKQKEIKQLNDKLQALEEKLNAVINNHSGTSTVELDSKTIVLDQNAPNPFAESTIIGYELKEDFSTALISISNNNGLVLKTYPITTKGKAQLTVYGSNLSSGVYRYTLIVDGKPTETKTMIKN